MIGDAFEYMASHPVAGVLCEFGVWQGLGLESIAQCAQQYFGFIPALYGFDSFEGMPVTQVVLHDLNRIVWRPGGYSETSVEAVQARVPSAQLIKGVFETLPPLLEFGITKVRFARIDCDIYEGYRDALRLLTPCISLGAVLLFDEGVAPDDPNYHDGIRDSGERAIREWQAETGIQLRTLQEHWTERLAVLE
jgi:hypothetical protein